MANSEIKQQKNQKDTTILAKCLLPALPINLNSNSGLQQNGKKTMFRTRLKITEENPPQTEEQILVQIIEIFARLKNRSQFFNPLKMCNFNWAKIGHSRSQFYNAQSRNQSPITTRNHKKLEDLPRAWVLSKNQRTKSEIKPKKNELLLPASQNNPNENNGFQSQKNLKTFYPGGKKETFKKT